MIANRSAPKATVVPILVYDDVEQALEFLARAGGPFGVRQYTVKDIGGHWWTFSQNIRDVAPDEWGAKLRT